MHNATKYGVLLAVLAVLAVPTAALTQPATGKLSLDLRGGVAIPLGDLDGITGLGGVGGASILWNFHPNWALRADFDYMKLGSSSDEFGVLLSPPMGMVFFGGSIETNFNAPRLQTLPLTFMFNVGAGTMKMKVDENFDPTHPASAFDNTYLAFQGGAKIGYQLKPWINIFVNGTLYYIVMDSDDTSVFENPSAGVTAFDKGWLIPVTAGVRLTFLR